MRGIFDCWSFECSLELLKLFIFVRIGKGRFLEIIARGFEEGRWYFRKISSLVLKILCRIELGLKILYIWMVRELCLL